MGVVAPVEKKSNSRSASQEILLVVWNPRTHYRIQQRPDYQILTLTFTAKLFCCLYPVFPCNILLLDSLTRNKRHSHFILSHLLTLITCGIEGKLWRGLFMHFSLSSCGSFLIRSTTKKKKARLSRGITSCTYKQAHAFQVFIKWSTKGLNPKDPADINTGSWIMTAKTWGAYHLLLTYAKWMTVTIKTLTSVFMLRRQKVKRCSDKQQCIRYYTADLIR